MTIMLASGWIEMIRIVNTDTWEFVEAITLDDPAEMRGSYSFDFSVDDKKLFITARDTSVACNDNRNKLEIFSVDIDGSDQQKVTDNAVPDYYPAAVKTLSP